MTTFEKKLRDTLETGIRDPGVDRLESLQETVTQSFRGSRRLILFGGLAKLVGSLALTVAGAIGFWLAGQTKTQIGAAALAVIGTVGVMGFSNALWSTLNHQAVLRELKRMELRLTAREDA